MQKVLSDRLIKKLLWGVLLMPVCLWAMDDDMLDSFLCRDLESILEPEVLACAENGTIESMQAMLDLGGNLYATDSVGQNVFHYAARGANGAMILWLASEFEKLRRLDWRFEADEDGKRPLHYAAQNDYFEGIEALMSWGFLALHANASDAERLTPLFYAAYHGKASMIRFLLKHGAFVDGGIDEERAETPIHYAIQNGHTEAVKALLERGARIDVADQQGRTPLDIAYQEGHQNIAALLLVGVYRIYGGLSPLHRAVFGYALGLKRNAQNQYTYTRIEQVLRRIGGLNTTDNYGLTPMQYAQLLGLENVIQLFHAYQHTHRRLTVVEPEEVCEILAEGVVAVHRQNPRNRAAF